VRQPKFFFKRKESCQRQIRLWRTQSRRKEHRAIETLIKILASLAPSWRSLRLNSSKKLVAEPFEYQIIP